MSTLEFWVFTGWVAFAIVAVFVWWYKHPTIGRS